MCGICGDDGTYRGKWWSPDDGWRFAALCDYCHEQYGGAKPQSTDYAFDKAYEYDIDLALAECDVL